MEEIDILIIGGGPAGLSAGIKAKELGAKNILIVERNKIEGGILNQCIHNGFGLHFFKEELTGPEYSFRLGKKCKEYNLNILFESMVLEINKNKEVKILTQNGIVEYKCKAIILASGCRERPRGALNIPGDRSAGVFTAGSAQELINMKGYEIGKTAVILGSGDIGLIMARRLTFENVEVKAVLEIMPYSSGLKRNISQCINDFNIPLLYNHTITEIVGKNRVEFVKISKVDNYRNIIENTEEIIYCDTVLLSVGLIPENEMLDNLNIKMSSVTGGPIVDSNYETSMEGLFICGNTLHVHDLVDNVTYESFKAGESAVNYINNLNKEKKLIKIENKNGIRYTIPNYIDLNQDEKKQEIKFRVDNIYRDKKIKVYSGENLILERKRKILTPGEMEIVNIDTTKINGNIFIEVGE